MVVFTGRRLASSAGLAAKELLTGIDHLENALLGIHDERSRFIPGKAASEMELKRTRPLQLEVARLRLWLCKECLWFFHNQTEVICASGHVLTHVTILSDEDFWFLFGGSESHFSKTGCQKVSELFL